MLYYDLFYTDVINDVSFYVNLREGSILTKCLNLSVVTPVPEFVVCNQDDDALVYAIKLAGVNFEDYFLQHEILLYKLDTIDSRVLPT